MNDFPDDAVAVRVVPAQVSDRRCPACGLPLGAQAFWCVVCNDYADDLIIAEAHETEEQR